MLPRARRSRRPGTLVVPETLEPRLVLSGLTAGNILVSSGQIVVEDNRIAEFTPAGGLVQEFAVPEPGDSGLRDVVVDGDGAVYGYNGTFDAWLTKLDPATSGYSHQEIPQFSTGNNVSYGGIAVYQNYVFLTDMKTGNDTLKGLLRVDTTDDSVTRFADTKEYQDINVGLDGIVYARYAGSGDERLDKFNPSTLAELGTLTFPVSNIRGVAANANGVLYAAAWNGNIYKFASDGTQQDVLDTDANNLSDLDLHPDGRIVVGGRFGDVLLTDESLDAVTSSFKTNDNLPVFVAFTDPGGGSQSDIQLGAATNSGAGKLRIDYDIAGADSPAFDIGIFRSADDTFTSDDVRVDDVSITESGDLSEGSHFKEYTIGSGVSLPGGEHADKEYYLLVVADFEDAVEEDDATAYAEDNTVSFKGSYAAGSSTIVVHGTDASDSVTASVAANVLTVTVNNVATTFPIAAADTLVVRTHGDKDTAALAGFSGDAVVYSGTGNDTVNTGSGDDVVTAGAGNDRVTVGSGNDSVDAGSGNDRVFAGAGADSVDGGDGRDTVKAGGGPDQVSGGPDDDRLVGSDGADDLQGDGGDDLVDGGAGADTARGGAGGDTLYGGNRRDILFGGAGHDLLIGGGDIDIAVGGDGNDVVKGGSGRDVLIGGDGADTVNGGGADDLLIGGRTAHDNNVAALLKIRAEWKYRRNYTKRSDNLRDGTGSSSGANGSVFLEPRNVSGRSVFDDAGAVDLLTGGSANDWFFANAAIDQLQDRSGDEELDELF